MDTSKISYLFFDFDGTITTEITVALENGDLKKQRILPRCHLDSIKAAHDLGHMIFLCTGRSRGSVLEMGEDWKAALDLPWDGMIFGASDMWYHGERISVTYVSREECLFWFNYCKDTQRALCYNGTEKPIRYELGKTLSQAELDDMYSDLEKQLKDNPMTNLSTVPAALDLDRTKTDMTVVHLPTYTDVFPAGCDKGSAITRYCQLIGAEMEQTICFGDSENDVDMFKVCAQSVAMKKAPTSLKALATYCAVTEYGVSEAISHFFGR